MARKNDSGALDGFGDGSHMGAMKDFGFSGSVGGKAQSDAKPRVREGAPTPMGGAQEMGHIHPHGHQMVNLVPSEEGGSFTIHHAHGGHSTHHPDGSVTHHAGDGSVMTHADIGGGMLGGGGGSLNTHPAGHHVVSEEAHGDRTVQRHAHGGYTVHHEDGRITHHDHEGAPSYRKGGAHSEPDGDEGMDTDIAAGAGGGSQSNFRRGGSVLPSMHPQQRKPKKPKAAKPKGVLTNASALNRPPRNPTDSATAPNQMPGGQMPYGVQPSAEPNPAAPAAPGMQAMRKGGAAKKKETA